ncbi:lytic murein transglycosylase [Ancylobacter amanitiformis]|uniref:Lytic murein transglycosylase n=1 Tax=Ancylobacter amanitiformis TaxID=217069 RepID=A0ABU0LNX0_9HYPH|nr:lytic murein transglycosylase [Ancylobacter amanitiformis]MDQ0510396.1 lytic murein transglycosylase [Ancylobacter amanitiformis]
MATISRAGLAGIALLIGTAVAAGPALAQSQPCGNSGAGFNEWLEGFKRQAVAQGVSARTVATALNGITYDANVVGTDRGQKVFGQSFFEFSDRMVANYRIQQGRALIQKNQALFDRIEQQFGVPGAVLVAFWGLETDFGAFMGDKNTLRSVASLAWDCRRAEVFRTQLLSALKIIDRGDLTPATMRGPWAGELGQFQFLPDHYFNYGVDFDGDGRVDLLRSTPDALASAANYIKALGWQRGQPWLEEVRVPANLPWDQADLSIKLPRAQWARFGVVRANGSALPADNLTGSVLLPMGRNGPAFLVYPNFNIFTEWNNSLTYATSAAYLAARVAGAGAYSRGQGKAIPVLSQAQVIELQRLLNARGHHVGRVDGIAGAATRQAIKVEQMRLGLPADSYPSPELLAALKAGR